MSRTAIDSLLSRGLRALDRIATPATASAHCDIPCGIYDPHLMQIGALTVIRMHQLLEKLPENDWNSFVRYVTVKEEHSELVKREARIFWGDYFKPEHLEKHKDLHDVVWAVMEGAGKTRQTVDMAAAQDLLSQTQRLAEIFWDTKGVATKKQPSNQAVGGEIVVPA